MRITQQRFTLPPKSKYTLKDVDRFKAINKKRGQRDAKRFPQLSRNKKPV